MSQHPNKSTGLDHESGRSIDASFTIRLIVNADDLGRGTAMDRGIFRAFVDGIVTSASLLANGPTFAEAAREVRTLGLPVGIHLNLAEGRSLSGEIRGLTAGDEFPGKAQTRRRLSGGAVNGHDLRAEIRTQIECLLAAGLRPDHLDSHQHTLLFPAVAEAVLGVIGQFGITAARLPQPEEPEAADPPGTLGDELALYRRLAPDLARRLSAHGLATPDGLWGMTTLDRLDEAVLGNLLRRLPPGTWELMVHPGGCDPADAFATQARETEVMALTSPAIRTMIQERQIQLNHFGDLRCAS